MTAGSVITAVNGHAVGLGKGVGVVPHTGERAFAIVAVGGLEPARGPGGMIAHTKAQAMGARDFGPSTYDVFLRADFRGIPAGVLGIEGIEIVVMSCERKKVFGTGAFVEADQSFRIPILRLPQIVNFHEAEFGRMTIGLDVVIVNWITLDVHFARVPVTLFGHALRGPVRPHAELGIAIPFWNLIIFDM